MSDKEPNPNLFDCTENLLQQIDLIYNKYGFESVVPKDKVREGIVKFNSDSALILKFSPDYFVMPSSLTGTSKEKIIKAKRETFFVKILYNTPLSSEMYEIYKQYYGLENILVVHYDHKRKDILIYFLSEIKYKKDLHSVPLDAIGVIKRIKPDFSKDQCKNIIENLKKSVFGN